MSRTTRFLSTGASFNKCIRQCNHFTFQVQEGCFPEEDGNDTEDTESSSDEEDEGDDIIEEDDDGDEHINNENWIVKGIRLFLFSLLFLRLQPLTLPVKLWHGNIILKEWASFIKVKTVNCLNPTSCESALVASPAHSLSWLPTTKRLTWP